MADGLMSYIRISWTFTVKLASMQDEFSWVKAGGTARHPAGQVRIRDQLEDRQDARPRHFAGRARHCRRGHRINLATSASGPNAKSSNVGFSAALRGRADIRQASRNRRD
jgi:hypothetical protein